MTDNKEQKNKKVKVPPNGALGLLALGHVGVELWRKARAESEQKSKKNGK